MRTRDLDASIKKLQSIYYGYKTFPSFDDLKDMFEFKSKGSVYALFQTLVEHGYLMRYGTKYVPTDKLISIPLYESVQAGFPSTPSDDVKEDINLQSFLVDHPQSTILIKVVGDSMIDSGILPGDIVVVDKDRQATLGDIIVGMVDGEYTLKTYDNDPKGNPILIPSNKNYPIIIPRNELKIFGVVTGTIRKYR